jgi:hypothetical protein
MVELCRKLIRENEHLSRTRDLLLPRLVSGQFAIPNFSSDGAKDQPGACMSAKE